MSLQQDNSPVGATVVKLLRFWSGEELVAEVYPNTGDVVKFKNPLQVFIVPPERAGGDPQLGLGAWIAYAKGTEYEIPRDKFMVVTDPVDQLAADYRRSAARFFAGLTVPNKPKLILE